MKRFIVITPDYTSSCSTQESYQNKRASAVIPTRAQCDLVTSLKPSNYLAGLYTETNVPVFHEFHSKEQHRDRMKWLLTQRVYYAMRIVVLYVLNRNNAAMSTISKYLRHFIWLYARTINTKCLSRRITYDFDRNSAWVPLGAQSNL